MDARFYGSEEIDIERLANDIVNVYTAQGYQAQQIGNTDQILVQLKKGGDFEAIIGMQAALSLTIQRTAGGVLAMIGHQKWLDKAAIGAVSIALPVLWPLAITAGVGAIRQASLGNQALNMVDGLVRQQRPGVRIGPVPAQLVPQLQQQWAPPPYSQTPVYVPPPQVVISQPAPQPQQLPAPTPAPTNLRCPNCNTPYEAGDTFCTGCGRSLTPPKTYCPNCHAEIKPGVSFCPNCGASTFQASSTPPTVSAPSAPAYTPPAPTYTPPTPTYTPPTPTYTPTPPVEPYTPTVAAQPAPQTYYVPPTPQEPPVMPQPKVTITPSTPKQEPPAITPAPTQRPQTPLYVPPVQPQPSAPNAQTLPNTLPNTPPNTPPKPIVSRPAAKPAFDSTTPWGTLIFGDGKQIQLSGERAVVGRYDHDLGGIKPEVDLSTTQGSDTISRIHAAFEHIGSTYTLTDLNSTNSTRINGKRLEPDKATPINDGDTLYFGKVTCTFKKA